MTRDKKAGDLTREERIENFEKGEVTKRKKSKRNPIKTILPEGDTSVVDNLEMMIHGMQLTNSGNGFSNYNSNFDSLERLQQEFVEFVRFCDEKRLAPTQCGLALWLGVTQATIVDWCNSSEHRLSAFMKTTIDFFQRFAEQKAMDGAMSPLIYFFQAKNYWGMQDKTEIVHKSQSTKVIDTNEQKRILETTPGVLIDTEFSVVEDSVAEAQKTFAEDFGRLSSASSEDFQKTLTEDFDGRLSEDFDTDDL